MISQPQLSAASPASSMTRVGEVTIGRRPRATAGPTVDVSFVMPCLNEARTLAKCIRSIDRTLAIEGIAGEIIVADNGSTDGSQTIARELGARVVNVSEKGYGNALRAGISAACAEHVIMGDSDDSYNFEEGPRLLAPLRAGYDIVLGNRFRGGILPGAMPWKNRWIGNPVLTWLGRLFFGCPIGDFHCGLRGVNKSSFEIMRLQATGMEFASEMVIKAALLGMKMTEVPVSLRPDGRLRPPHLRPWADGWRHLRLMLLCSPRWLFLIPGIIAFVIGCLGTMLLSRGVIVVGHVGLDIHTLLVSTFACIFGHQLMVLGMFTEGLAVSQGLRCNSSRFQRLAAHMSLGRGIGFGIILALSGIALFGTALWDWRSAGFGALEPRVMMRSVVPALGLFTLGMQSIFASFFFCILDLNRRWQSGLDQPSKSVAPNR